VEAHLDTGSPLTGILHLSPWDVALIVGVSLHATTIAYLHDPRWKALVLTLPVPFTLASLSVGLRVDATNVAALVLLMGYTCGVYLLHGRWRAPIVPAIVLCAAGYCGLAALLAPRLPRGEAAFWALAAAVFVAAAAAYRAMPPREEPGHRSPMPVYLKLPLVATVILVLVIIKQYLQGFMTLFPMVGVIASYEGRHCLWTLTRQIPVLTMSMVPMLAVMRVLYPLVGLPGALVGAWVVFLAVLVPFTLRQWARHGAPGRSQPNAPG
jgi:hypothetical protein